LFPVKKYIAVGEIIVFCVVFCRSVIVLFLLAIVLPPLALRDLLSNEIKLYTSFQSKSNPIENCTRIFFTLYGLTMYICVLAFASKTMQ
jgi:hypothetical protein